MIDYDKIIEWLTEDINDMTASLISFANTDTEYQHGKRVGVIMGYQEIQEKIEELRMEELCP